MPYLPHYEWAVAMGAMFIAWSYFWVKPRFGFFPAAFLGYIACNGIWFWVWVENRYYPLDAYNQMAVRYFAADSIARLLLLIVPLMLFSKNKMTFSLLGELFCRAFMVLNSIFILLGYFTHGCVKTNSCGGIGNPSIMASLSICMLPLVVRSWNTHWIVFSLVVAASFASGSSIALGLLALYVFGYLLRYKAVAWAAVASILPVVLGAYHLGVRELFSTGDRLTLLKMIMPAWAISKNIPSGTGIGTFHVLSINLQEVLPMLKVNKYAGGYHWNTFHNDWAQMLFEGGVIGLVLMTGTYISAFRNAFRERELGLAASIFLFGIYMCVNPALHHAVPALFAGWLFTYALRKTNNHKEPLYA